MDDVVVLRAMVGPAHMQVCAKAGMADQEILDVCNRENPSGTTLGWSVVCRDPEPDPFWGKTGPVPCADDPERTHFLVAC